MEVTNNSKSKCDLPKGLDPKRIPKHVAIIMDGNGRWAGDRGLPRVRGHSKGVETLRLILKLCSDWGVKALTVFAFSTENWSRPDNEVEFLLNLFEKVIQDEFNSLQKESVKLRFIGDLKEFPTKLVQKLEQASEDSSSNNGICLNVCTNYGGRRELVNVAKKLAQEATEGKINPKDIDERLFESYLHTNNTGDPDLLIRTSGECRISNFLLWQLAYSEIYITDVLWPDFGRNDLQKALIEFQSRKRRFGGLESNQSRIHLNK
tara:strand:- start:10993 stop:11781 length:789 start_codon:yes stop_codon:yes gene_type:complete